MMSRVTFKKLRKSYSIIQKGKKIYMSLGVEYRVGCGEQYLKALKLIITGGHYGQLLRLRSILIGICLGS